MKLIQAKTPQQSVASTAARPELFLKHNTDIRYCGCNPELRPGVNAKLENQGKVSYIDLP